MKNTVRKQLLSALFAATLLGSSVTPAFAATYTFSVPYSANLQTVLTQQLASLGINNVKVTTTTPTTTTTTTNTKPPTTTTTPTSDSALLSAPLTAEETQMINLVNKERTSRGLKALIVDMRLVKIARMKSLDMIKNNYFSHTSPTWGSPFDLMKSQGITYHTAGENIAGAATVDRAHTLLMNSAGHRANILSTSYTSIGIGIIHGGPYGLMISQEFIG
ncbi:MAG: CAP domain-containing protein [Pelosinus sp.]|nr:CAP domain-containing protein [Pelosinus sp.]